MSRLHFDLVALLWSCRHCRHCSQFYIRIKGCFHWHDAYPRRGVSPHRHGYPPPCRFLTSVPPSYLDAPPT